MLQSDEEASPTHTQPIKLKPSQPSLLFLVQCVTISQLALQPTLFFFFFFFSRNQRMIARDEWEVFL